MNSNMTTNARARTNMQNRHNEVDKQPFSRLPRRFEGFDDDVT